MGWKEDFAREKELYEAKQREKQEAKEKNKPVLSETEKLAKTGNFVIKGIAFWFLIPVFAIIAIVGVFLVFGVWDMITG
ncbi:MAG TPA: hypothetical protein VEY70_14160 [Metabacillus sp.]|nr:hypothetical protein [Metabacillus sp.]